MRGWLPQPVLIIGTYDKDGRPNAMNAAFAVLFCSCVMVVLIYILIVNVVHCAHVII